MVAIEDIVKKYQAGAQFVINARMLGLKPMEFHQLAEQWYDDGGPGFNVVGVPHRSVVEGEFLISRMTVMRTTADV